MTALESEARIGGKIKGMTDIQTETDISTDGLTREAGRQTDREGQTDRQIGRGCLWWSRTVRAEQGCRRGEGGSGSHRTG